MMFGNDSLIDKKPNLIMGLRCMVEPIGPFSVAILDIDVYFALSVAGHKSCYCLYLWLKKAKRWKSYYNDYSKLFMFVSDSLTHYASRRAEYLKYWLMSQKYSITILTI